MRVTGFLCLSPPRKRGRNELPFRWGVQQSLAGIWFLGHRNSLAHLFITIRPENLRASGTLGAIGSGRHCSGRYSLACSGSIKQEIILVINTWSGLWYIWRAQRILLIRPSWS